MMAQFPALLMHLSATKTLPSCPQCADTYPHHELIEHTHRQWRSCLCLSKLASLQPPKTPHDLDLPRAGQPFSAAPHSYQFDLDGPSSRPCFYGNQGMLKGEAPQPSHLTSTPGTLYHGLWAKAATETACTCCAHPPFYVLLHLMVMEVPFPQEAIGNQPAGWGGSAHQFRSQSTIAAS